MAGGVCCPIKGSRPAARGNRRVGTCHDQGTRVAVVTQERRLMPYGKPPRQLERGRSNRFLAALPPHDFALLTPHLRTVTLERGTILHDAGDEIERVYFPHSGMVSLVAVMQSGAAVATATIGRAGVIGASTGLGVKSAPRE